MALSTGTLTMQKLHPGFDVEIGGVDLRRPLDDGTLIAGERIVVGSRST